MRTDQPTSDMVHVYGEVYRKKGSTETEEKYFKYLDKLRDSGATNMWGASPYIQRNFSLGREEAINVLSAWMESFE